MIVRIPSEGQYDLPGAYLDDLNDIDNQLVEIVEREDRQEFERLLKKILDLVRANGVPVPIDELVESDIVLPPSDITLEEAKDLFIGEGLIPD